MALTDFVKCQEMSGSAVAVLAERLGEYRGGNTAAREDNGGLCEERVFPSSDHVLNVEKMMSLGMMASGIAHEINNPNQSILSHAEFLSKAWGGVLPVLESFYRDFGNFVVAGHEYEECRQRVMEAIEGLLKSSRRIDLIAQEIRRYARGGPVRRFAPVNANAVVRSALVLLSNVVRKSTENFEAVYGRNLPPVLGDFQRLEQVVINLVQNACQALPDRRRSVRVETLHDAAKDAVVFVVRDEGTGIPADILPRVREPFFSTRWESNGNGLGLWIASNIVEEHRGELKIDSTPGEGTVITITLPAAADVAQ